MSLQAKRELLYRMRTRYQEANRSEKSQILDGFIAATGYHRKYAAAVLACNDSATAKNARTPMPRVYDEAVRQALVAIWNAAGQICSKRLCPFLPEFVETLERFGHLRLSDETRRKLLRLSAASIDRLLKTERAKHPRGKCTTKPANLLKQRIRVRTFSDWDEAIPGFFEADLVAHCGDRVDGSFVNSLVVTDIASGWTEFVPILRKSEADVIAGLDAIRSIIPIPMLGLDTDNGCEFINYELLNYCEKNSVTFTRSRAYKKNDQAHIEQKNGSVIRRIVGYDRYEGVGSVCAILRLYRVLRLYVNFFQPSSKLIRKTRIGSRTKKQYDTARTPVQRLLDSDSVSKEAKRKLIELRNSLDPVDLFEQVGKLQEELWTKAASDALPESTNLGITKETAPSKTLIAAPPTVQPSLTELEPMLNLKPLTRFKRVYKVRAPHTWRTRPDPLEGTYEYAKLVYSLEPQITSYELMARLKQKFPEKITGKEIKTLQRRLAKWRREALQMQITTLETDPPYDSLPFNKTLQELTRRVLQLEERSG